MPAPRLAAPAAVLAVTALVLSGCGSDAPSSPGSSAASSSAPSSAASSSSSAPSSSSSSAAPASSSAAAGSGRTGSCTDSQAKYCDDFSDKSSGWAVQNTQSGYTQYDDFQGGTYRIGLRGQGIVGQGAPVKLSTVSPRYSVQVDADVALGPSSTSTTAVGYRCWTGTTGTGSGSGFQLTVNGQTAEIGVFSGLSGDYTRLKTQPFVGLRLGRTNHLAVQCLQRTGSSGVYAQLGLKVNNSPAIQVTYPQGSTSVEWQVSDGLSLLAQGTDADVFYDNVSVAPVTVT